VNVSAILLAAGSSSRMGRSKQLLPLEDTTVLRHAAKIVLASSLSEIRVVLGSGAEEHKHEIEDLPVHIITNNEWANGMGSSIKSALRHILASKINTDAIIILVCDQVMLTTDHINRMLDKFKENIQSIIASEYDDTIGVPVLFNKNLFDRIMKLKDHQGAKVILQELPNLVVSISFPNGKIDLDTPEDYQSFLAKKEKSGQ
jgi:molybdenum cofactor cytidylyltransferase